MQVAVPFLSASGSVQEKKIEADRFRRRGRRVLLKEAVINAEARRRVGTHAALTRGEVSGSTKKMYAQKHTGRARHGNFKAPQMRHGGMAHAKKPREFGWTMPLKARRAALEAAIRGKLDDGEVRVVARFGLDAPKTKSFVAILDRLGIEGKSFLVVPAVHSEPLRRSCRNVPGAAYRVASDLAAYEVLKQKYLVLEEAALQALQERFGHGQPA